MLVRKRKRNICYGCEHYSENNDDVFRGCRAFPNGIPRPIGGRYTHDKIIKSVDDLPPVAFAGIPDYLCEVYKEEGIEQVGDYVYTPTKREYNIFGEKIKIFQKGQGWG